MTGRDRKRLHVIRKVIEGSIKQRQASELLQVSIRQIKRLVRRVKDEGDKGIIHGSRGRRSHHAIDMKTKQRALEVYTSKYIGFGPTLASEKLLECEGIEFSEETLRLWLKAEGIGYPRRRSRPHHKWRQRKECFGELVQVDGSHHDWLEGRGPKLVLMAYIDDATGRAFARFYMHEGTVPAFDSFKRYVRRYGLPCALYLDRHTTYKSNRNLTAEEELAGVDPFLSEFERAMKELDVEVIHAYSPQAKGRVERLFKTLQDRLVKEMRLLSICSLEDANSFLEKYLTFFNRKFSIRAAKVIDLHRVVSKGLDLRSILCFKKQRYVRNDFTVAHKGKMYQLLGKVKTKYISVEDWMDGSIHFRQDGQMVSFKEIVPTLTKEQDEEKITSRPKPPVPDKGHPWRNFRYGSVKDKKLQADAIDGF